MSETHYEMLWDCLSCGAKGLLAKSQKHCPRCGAAQDPEKRYFPEEGQEVEVQGHQYAGADWHCAYCQSPNGAAAAFCGACGGPRDGSKEVNAIEDKNDNSAQKTEQPTPAPSGGLPWFKIIVALLLIASAFFIVRYLWKSDETVRIASLDWQREIDVEQYVVTKDAKWCSELPRGAYSIQRTMEEKGKKKVPDGETCRDVRVDKRDGTFTKKKECTPRYKEIPEMAEKCRYQINQWKVVRAAKAAGTKGTEPRWPSPDLITINKVFTNAIGNERMGSRRESYSAQLQPAKGEMLRCTLKPEVWKNLNPGETVIVKVRASGGVDCDGIKRL